LSGRPLTPPCVPFGTRRFNRFHATFLFACSQFLHTLWVCSVIQTFPHCTVSVYGITYSDTKRSLPLLGFHPTIRKSAGSPRFCFSRTDLHSSRSLDFCCSALPALFVLPSSRDIPLYGTMASADFWTFSHTSLYELLRFFFVFLARIVQTSPGKSQ
jgi:hypothetical protein